MLLLDECLSKFDLAGIVTKCTGDGWLVMTDVPEHVFSLCALAIMLREGCGDNLHELVGIPTETVPPVRICIGAGRDIRVVMPDRRVDWMGDSARRATRMEQFCMPGEILVCEQVRNYAAREFEFKALRIRQRLQMLRMRRRDICWEEDFSVWVLRNLAERYHAADCAIDGLAENEEPQWLATLLEESRWRES